MRRAILVLALALGGAGEAWGVDYYFTASNCVSEDNNDAHALERGDLGIMSWSTTLDLDVWCPVSGVESDTIDLESASVAYVDNHTTLNVSCTLYLRTATGGYYTSTTPTSSGTGSGTLSWTTTALPNSGSSMSSIRTYGFQCTIPKDGAGRSSITYYKVSQVNP